ncbi:MAG: glycoside hydrolase 15-related [Deltaproteobacteria bacterium]|nr:glycoside hydrolase 15-related [Deltaproteobacteria bacterium]
MRKDSDRKEAFGGPGIPPRWTHAAKEGVGTAYASSSRLWFTIWNGVVTEVYYPTVDRPQLRDLQFLITDGVNFFHEEKRHLRSITERLSRHVLGYRITNSDPEGRYSIVKEVLTDPHLPCLLVNTTLTGGESFLKKLRLYALCAPHLGMGGWGNNARVVEIAGRKILTAEKDGVWLALGATFPFSRLSCGYVGQSDGWTDLAVDYRMDWEFDRATDGNIALIGELDLGDRREFTMGLAFGDGLHNAATTLLESLAVPFGEQRERYTDQWNRSCRRILPLEKAASDGGDLYHGSYSLLLAHEDKTFPGAFIASLSIPWGESKGDDDRGGYHLVWTRDMVKTATGLLAAGNTETPLRALIYLAVSQRDDGGFSQNFWIDGEPYWSGVQLDEVAFPILLAWRLLRKGGLGNFDPYPMVMRAARYLILHGPATPQERWEEAGGYSPSTIASNIAALVCAASFARERGDGATAAFLEEYADFLECHVEAWTVTTEGTLVPRIPRHYIRILPPDVNDPFPPEDPNLGVLALANQPPGSRWRFPGKEIVDGGFLELVRYGIRKADDPVIVDSLRVLDAVLKVDTPNGPCWRRYNHDGYGQREDGGPFAGYGKGRAWPLLTGERGHYELAAGRAPGPYLQAMEGFASPTGLLPEQVWDEPDRPDLYMFLGRPTGSAKPLMWAHAEYIKLLRSAVDGKVFDLVPEVADRYLSGRRACKPVEIWKHNRQVSSVRQGFTLRIQAGTPFLLHWTQDDWGTSEDSHSTPTALGIEYFDIDIQRRQSGRIRFTFFWTDAGTWEGRDFEVAAHG